MISNKNIKFNNRDRYNNISLWYLIKTFLKIGSTSFGGFMSLISIVQKQVVEKDKVIKNEDVLDGISLATILPGPVAVNVVTYIGYKLRGFIGAIVSMVAIILPSFILMIVLSYFYFKYGKMLIIEKFFLGIFPCIIAIILSVSIDMGKKSIKDFKQLIICIISAVSLIFFSGYLTTLIIIFIAGLIGYFLYKKDFKLNSSEHIYLKKSKTEIFKILIPVFLLILIFIFFLISPKFGFGDQSKLVSLFTTFGGMGVTLLGGGYVFIPMIHDLVVTNLGWLNNKEFADSIALGQITPGPIMISSTFIGYKLMKFWGAVVATIGMFGMPGLLMIVCSKYYLIINKSQIVGASLKGIRVAVIGMILSATYVLIVSVEINILTIAIFLSVFLLSLWKKIDAVFLVLLSGIAGFLFG